MATSLFKNSVTSALKVLFVFLSLLGGTAMMAEARPAIADTARAFQLFQKADSLQKFARYDSSSSYFERAARLYEKAGSWRRVVDSNINLAINSIESARYETANTAIAQTEDLVQEHTPGSPRLRAKLLRLGARLDMEQSQYDSAITKIQKGLELLSGQQQEYARLRAYLLLYLGEVYDSQGKLELAMEQFFQSLDIFHRSEPPGSLFVSKVYNSIGATYQKMGDNGTAMEYYRKSIEIDRNLLGPDHPNVARGINNIAIIHYYRGDYQQALDYMKEATQTLSRYWGEQHPQVAAGYNNISIVYSETGNLEASVRYMRRSIEIKEQVIGKVNLDVAIGYQNLGALHYDMEAYDQAIKYYKKALSLHRQIFEGRHPEIANIYANLGEAYSAKKAYDEALQWLEKDLEMNIPLLGSEHPFIADTHTKIAQNFMRQQNPEAALQHIQKAISILSGNNPGENGGQEGVHDSVTHPVLLMEALQGRGEAYRALFQQTGELDYLEKAMETYLSASSLVNNMQAGYRSDESKLVLAERADAIYKRGLDTAYQLYRRTGSSKQVAYALFFAEQGKAQVLLRQLKEMEAKSFAGVPDSLISREQQLRRQITRVHRSIAEKTDRETHIDSLQMTSLQDSVFTLKQQLSAHIEQLEREYPQYYRLKYQEVTITPEDVKAMLKPGQTMIEYASGRNALYAFVVNRAQIRLQKVGADTTLDSLIHQFRTVIEENDKQEFAHTSNRLYETLIAPLAPHVKSSSLIIIPDGTLHYLPFEALTTKPAGPETDYQEMPYLLEQHAISYAPSATLLQFWRQDQRQEGHKSLVGVAPVFSQYQEQAGTNKSRDTPPVHALPLSRYEVQQVDSIMNSKGYLTKLYLEQEASEAIFKQSVQEQYEIIHLATHAFLSQDSVTAPGIHFAREPGHQEDEDGILRLQEVYNLQLNARLVVLSACETGLGKLQRGEGIISLARAFEYAGAQNLLVSLWKVDDRSTSELMIEFYRHLDNNGSLREAARQAKLHLLNESQYAAPRFWAPFVLIGE
ncbi:CHAT domain-containing protein [Halalkalibaculum sp. DA384]|uniref:CHAT domain-containing protein n=1 Tax=Halalkalibaculum sp. DA384 TaxID=3373606 RepID=UPI003754F126